MSTGTASVSRLPGDDLVRREDLLEERVPRELVGHALDPDARGQHRKRGAVQERDGDPVAGAERALDGDPDEVGIATLEEMEGGGHQKTMKLRAWRIRSAMSSRLTGTTGCLSAFQSEACGMAEASTWKGTPSRRRVPRNLGISSPSTGASVSSASRCPAPAVSTNVTWFSPATPPTPMRMASKARCDVRGSLAMSTRTGEPDTSVQCDEAVGAVDDIGQHDEAAVRHVGGVFQGDATLLAAVGAGEQLDAARGQRAQTAIGERAHAVVDQIQVHVGAAVERGLGEAECGGEVRMLGRRRDHQPELFAGQLHRGSSRSEEHTSELQSPVHLVCRLLLEKKKKKDKSQRVHHH